MPKKFQGENSKAAVAKARKAAVLNEKLATKQKEEEDAYWEDDNKHVKRKQQRKESKDKRKEEQSSRKQEARRLLEEEEEAIKIKDAKAGKPVKTTRAQIQADREIVAAEEAAAKKQQEPKTHLDAPLEQNTNLVLAEQEAAGVLVGRNVEEAISALSVGDSPGEKHPERRMKAAYKSFEEVHMARMRAENPNLRISQIKQMLKKDWNRSPENPLNQRTASYNTK